MISSFPFHCLLYFFMSLAIQAPPNSSLLTSYVSWPSTIFSHLLIHCSTTFLHVLSLVLLISSTIIKILSPGFQGSDNCKKFSIIDIIISLSRREWLGEVRTRMPFAIVVSLEEHGPRGKVRCISGYSKGGGEVGKAKDRFGQDQWLQWLKHWLALERPVPGKIYFGQINKGRGDIGVIRNESLVEVGKAKEGSNILYLGECGPWCNAINFDRIHGEFTRFNDHPKILDFWGGKFAFF